MRGVSGQHIKQCTYVLSCKPLKRYVCCVLSKLCCWLFYRCFSGLLWVLLNATYFTSNLGFSLYLSIYCKTLTGDLTLARVLTSELLFFVMAATLAVFIIIIYTTSYGRSVLEAQVSLKPSIYDP